MGCRACAEKKGLSLESSHHGGGGAFFLPGAEPHYPPDLDLEPMHLAIRATLDLDAQTIEAEVTITVEARSCRTRTLTLDAANFGEIAVSSEHGPVTSSYDGEKLRVTFEDGFRVGERRMVSLAYRLERPSAGLYFSKPTAAEPNAPLYAVTDHETERARYWLPTVDHLSVRPTLEFWLRARKDLSILANGKRIDESAHEDGTKTVHYRLSQRCPSYLTCFAIGDFARFVDDSLGEIPIEYYAPRSDFTEAHLRTSFNKTPKIMEWMVKRLGVDFPYPKYFQFAATGIGGAMENISLTSWDDRLVFNEALMEEIGWLLDCVNVHEMAHSYFGDLVVCRDFAHVWLKESWATYMEACWLEDEEGLDAMQYELLQNRKAYFKESDEKYARSIVTRTFSSSFDMFDRHLYPGGACRLHMLRKLLGDEVFWAGVRIYLERHADCVVETDDFRRAMEAASGRSLVQYFEQWFYRAGYPKLKASFSFDAEKKIGTFEFEQTQGKSDDPPFGLEFDVAWTVNGNSQRQRVVMNARREVITATIDAEPTSVRVDPEGESLFKLEFTPGVSRLRAQLRAPDLLGRVEAGRALIAFGSSTYTKEVAEAYASETSWGVQMEWAEALGEANTEAALSALLSLATSQTEAKSLRGVFEALGQYRDDRIGPVLISRLEGELPERARESAYVTLGRQRSTNALDTLLRGADTPRHSGFAQQGALVGLGEVRDEKAVDLLIERMQPGRITARARFGALQGIGTLGKFLEDHARVRVIEAVTARLRDPDKRVALHAARALGTMGARESIAALEGYAKTLPRQDEVTVARIIQSIRRSGKSKAKELHEQLEELRSTVRKLEQKLSKLEA